MASDLAFFKSLLKLYVSLGKPAQVARVKRDLNKAIAVHIWGE